MHDDDIKVKWTRYFNKLFNAIRVREFVLNQDKNHIMETDIGLSHDEVRPALCMMGRFNAVGVDEILIKVWPYLDEPSIRWLTYLFNVIFWMAKISNDRRLTVVVPFYRNKVDAQNRSKYHCIKFLSYKM